MSTKDLQDCMEDSEELGPRIYIKKLEQEKLSLDVSMILDTVIPSGIEENIKPILEEAASLFDKACKDVEDYGVWNLYEKHMFEALLRDLFSYCVCSLRVDSLRTNSYLENLIHSVLHTGAMLARGSCSILKPIGFASSRYLNIFLREFKILCATKLGNVNIEV